MISINDFDYTLPSGLIATHPTHPRDESRLMLINRSTGSISHHHFFDLTDLLPEKSMIVLNESKVLPTRLYAVGERDKKHEIFLTRILSDNIWEAMISPGINIGTHINLNNNIRCQVIDQTKKIFKIRFSCNSSTLYNYLHHFGHTPLPHYIDTNMSEEELRNSYQTVYANDFGSVAAPTAGLHFTDELLFSLSTKFAIERVSLHVSLGTFAPIDDHNILSKSLHSEIYQVNESVYHRLLNAKIMNQAIIAVGTTTSRTLETIIKSKRLDGETNIFIYPPYRFGLVKGLITNFHLPRSSLLMLVTAFCSFPNTESKFTSFKESLIYRAYQEAIKERYRFYSFGDAMLII